MVGLDTQGQEQTAIELNLLEILATLAGPKVKVQPAQMLSD
jgi:hypothetical protein